MSWNETTLEETEAQWAIADKWLRYVQHAGMWDERMTPANVYVLGGTIYRDPVVRERAKNYEQRDPEYPAMIANDHEATVQALMTMTARELQALRDRVAERWGKK